MRRFILTLLAGGILSVAVQSCRTTEANYRQAYEQAKAGRDGSDDIVNTIYGKERNNSTLSTLVAGGDSIGVVSQRVSIAEPRDGEVLQPQYFVVAHFKQLFNARSLRNRLREAGYGDATLLVTGEPLFYVAVAPVADDASWKALLSEFNDKKPVPVKEPYPMLLRTVKRSRR